MYCKNCGKNIGKSHFCPYCGTKSIVETSIESENNIQLKRLETYNPMNPISAYKSMFKKYAQFNGRSSRSEYWFAALTSYIVTLILVMIVNFVIMATSSDFEDVAGVIVILYLIYVVGTMLPTLALGVRRLHDVGKSGSFMWLLLIPFFGSLILFMFFTMDSQPGDNKYGSNPKELMLCVNAETTE